MAKDGGAGDQGRDGPPASPAARRRARRRLLAALLASLLAAALLYLPSVRHVPLLSDDYPILALLVEDGRLTPTRLLAEFTLPRHGSHYYRPLFYLSYALDYALGGTDPLGYHLSNALLHGLATWLLLAWLLVLGAGWGWALGAAVLFLVHPVHVEAVSWVAGRSALLSSVAVLGALAAWTRGRRQGGSGWFALAALLLAAGLLSHESAVVLPPLLLLTDLLLRRELGERAGPAPGRRWWAGPWGLLLAVLAGWWTARAGVLEGGGLESYAEKLQGAPDLLGRVAASAASLLGPWPSWLLPRTTPGTAPFSGEGLLLLLLGAGALARNRRCALAGVALCLLALGPAAPLLRVGGELADDRLRYLSSAGAAALLGAAVAAGGVVLRRRFAGLLLLGLALAGAWRTLELQRGWIEAGTISRDFLAAVRGSGFSTVVVPRLQWLPYADRSGGALGTDRRARFVPLEDAGAPAGELALLLNAPRAHRNAYIFWVGLDRALLPLFGEPGVDVLYSEVSGPGVPGDDLLGPLLAAKVPLLRWDGERLQPVRLDDPRALSIAGRQREAARVPSLGRPRPLTPAAMPMEAFRPEWLLAATDLTPGGWRYALLSPFGPGLLPARPERTREGLRFALWQEPEAAAHIAALALLRQEDHPERLVMPDRDVLPILVFIEVLDGQGQVIGRSEPALVSVLL